jgi:hypothetical protein
MASRDNGLDQGDGGGQIVGGPIGWIVA